MLMKMDLSVIAIIGIIMLVGIVKKNAIMMIDFRPRRPSATMARRRRRAIHQACLLRFRPIMMTTVAAIMGGLPIAPRARRRRRGCGSRWASQSSVGFSPRSCSRSYITPVIYLSLEDLRGPRGRGPLGRGPPPLGAVSGQPAE